MALIYIVEDDENIREIENNCIEKQQLRIVSISLIFFIIFYDINQCHNFSLCLSLYIPLQHQAGRPCLHKTALSHVFYLFLIIAYDM